MTKKAMLVLEDGTLFEGRSLGAVGERRGEVVFNTSMTGYQEILTDPSYKGQFVTMTYPLIGNYGINPEDMEADEVHLEGLIAREFSRRTSNFRATMSLGDFLTSKGVVGIEGIDTRMLTRRVRDEGSMRAILSSEDLDPVSLRQKVTDVPSTVGRDMVQEVTCAEPYEWTEGYSAQFHFKHRSTAPPLHVVAIDYGVKRNILRSMIQEGFRVSVVPASTPAEAILEQSPDGVFLSNGPGDPEPVTTAVEQVRTLIGKVPVFGICLGHQILSLAAGAKTFKMKFGHHGGNQPVKDLETGRVEITSQNHSYAVSEDDLDACGFEVTHLNLNDRTVEGMRHRELPVFSVQYHPEAAPGPHDATHLFHRFREVMER
ncbi:MAG: glutamine-hydrolyzing carbamoyl-phosphate synthase small subunit [Planctomycetota bacterium]